MPKQSHENGSRSRKPFLATIAAFSSLAIVTAGCSGGKHKSENTVPTTAARTAPTAVNGLAPSSNLNCPALKQNISIPLNLHHTGPNTSTVSQANVGDPRNTSTNCIGGTLVILSDGYADLEAVQVDPTKSPPTANYLGFLLIYCNKGDAIISDDKAIASEPGKFTFTTSSHADPQSRSDCADGKINQQEALELIGRFSPGNSS